VYPNLASIALRAAAGEVEGPQVASRDADLAREVRHGVLGQLVDSARKAPSPEQELQQRREAQARRAGRVAQQLQLVADQREMVDDIIQTDLAGHLRGSRGLIGSRTVLMVMR
jgi:hypothetical protein